MPRVFITNDAGLNFTAAERYGELVRCSSGKLNVFNPERVASEVATALSSFTDQDYLLLAGGSMSMLFAGMYLPDNIQRLRLLVWDAKGQDYFVRTITI